jgi:hypothetical protein
MLYKVRVYTQTHSEYVMVSGTRLNVTFIVHCLYSYVIILLGLVIILVDFTKYYYVTQNDKPRKRNLSFGNKEMQRTVMNFLTASNTMNRM